MWGGKVSIDMEKRRIAESPFPRGKRGYGVCYIKLGKYGKENRIHMVC